MSQKSFCPSISRFRVHDIGDPYVTYVIKVTLQQLSYEKQTAAKNGTRLPLKQVWKTIGTAFAGPKNEAGNIDRMGKGNSSSPQVAMVALHTVESLPEGWRQPFSLQECVCASFILELMM